jgi:glyoxalase family protein
LHHVTSTVADAQEDLDFYSELLGLRLVKKTVNFDNHNVYHFYYGNERGEPGTIMTTFPYADMGVREGVKGAGQITVTSFSVPSDALDFWRARLRAAGIAFEDDTPRFGESAIVCADPSGLAIRIVGTTADARTPWVTPHIGAGNAVRGVDGITMIVHDARRSLQLLTGMLGFEVVGEDAARTRVAVRGDGPGRRIDVIADPNAAPAINGIGTVHHVAMAVSTGEEQLEMRRNLIHVGCRVTEVRDRQYFHSIYFREPGGVLYEIATVPPGFTLDEDITALGKDLKLPPWEEPHRSAIEARLPRVSYA